MFIYNDLPTTGDKLEWQAEVEQLAGRIMQCTPPHVLGIHGDWGSGKTSFMRQIQCGLGGTMPEDQSVRCEHPPNCFEQLKPFAPKAVTIWFDAWRYQNEPVPAAALLYEMRRQLSFAPALVEQIKKTSYVAVASMLDSLGGIAKVIGIEGLPSTEKIEKRGEQWEKEHFSVSPTSHSIREQLTSVVEKLLPDNDVRLVVFIDDLDRCNPKAAIRLLEGLKIYLSIPRCVFVLGMNERILVDVIREETSAGSGTTSDELRLRASHYLEKICGDIFRLPSPRSPIGLLRQWIENADQGQALLLGVHKTKCLPPNPRRIKALANQWPKFAVRVPFPEEHSQQALWAVRVLIVIYVHQFHRDLWERWHFDIDFWTQIRAWCIGETKEQDFAKALKLTLVATGFDDDNRPKLASAFVNPGEIDIFWIGALIFEYKDKIVAADFRPLLAWNEQ